jgi:hypothetical protein
MMVYEIFAESRSEEELKLRCRWDENIGKSSGSFYGFYNSRGTSVSSAQPCWRGYRCFGYSSSSREIELLKTVRSVNCLNGAFDILKLKKSGDDAPLFALARYIGCAKRIAQNSFAVKS